VWFGAGIGGGSTTGEDSGNEAGPAVYLRAGGTVTRDFLIGGEGIGWYWSSGDEELLRTSVSLAMLFYPVPRGNLVLKGAAGFAHAETKRPTEEGGMFFDVQREDGFAFALGAGYDIRLSQTLSITPNIDLVGYNFSGFNTGLALLSVGVTWH
jgi:hypothetical protein